MQTVSAEVNRWYFDFYEEVERDCIEAIRSLDNYPGTDGIRDVRSQVSEEVLSIQRLKNIQRASSRIQVEIRN